MEQTAVQGASKRRAFRRPRAIARQKGKRAARHVARIWGVGSTGEVAILLAIYDAPLTAHLADGDRSDIRFGGRSVSTVASCQMTRL
jgi:hypothetical protein